MIIMFIIMVNAMVMVRVMVIIIININYIINFGEVLTLPYSKNVLNIVIIIITNKGVANYNFD